MRSGASSKEYPASPADWQKLIAEAPGEDRPLTPTEEERFGRAVFVPGGGYQAVQAAVAAKRSAEQRVSVRFSRDVLDYFKAGGEGWQSRINEALRQWIATHENAATKRI